MRHADGDSLPSETVSIDGNSIHYFVGGEGPPLVLLHGGIIDAADISWGELLGPLAADARVYAPDLPGYGRSDFPEGDLSLPRHVEWMNAFVDELGLDAPLVAGISMGGGIAVGLALEHPDSVGGIVPIDAFGLGSELPSGLATWLLANVQVTNHLSVALTARSRRVAAASLAALAHDADALPEWVVDRVVREANRPNAGAAFRSFRASEVTRTGYRTDYSERVAGLSIPAHFVHGADDDLLPASWSRRAAERADADLTILDDCGHLSTLERSEAIRSILQAEL